MDAVVLNACADEFVKISKAQVPDRKVDPKKTPGDPYETGVGETAVIPAGAAWGDSITKGATKRMDEKKGDVPDFDMAGARNWRPPSSGQGEPPGPEKAFRFPTTQSFNLSDIGVGVHPDERDTTK
jgi:hypothetical protein